MTKVHTSIRLKQIMKEKNLKQVHILQLAKPICTKYGERLEKNDLSQYVSGKTEPGQVKVCILAEALNVSESWLMGLDVPKERISPIGTPYNPIVHEIPILGRIAAGLPIMADENIEGYTYTERNGGYNYFALKVQGDSMNAINIPDGSIIIVRQQPTVENGEIAVVKIDDGDYTVKRYKEVGKNVQLIPQSFNPEHTIQQYNRKNVEVIGKVVECRTEF